MTLDRTLRQKPEHTGQSAECLGEAGDPQHKQEDAGSALIKVMLTRENLQQAFRRVRANRGAAGVGGLDVDQTALQLQTTWPVLREQLLNGVYRPKPVLRVMIPKPGGGQRGLGIPTVTVRLIQQALLQVLQPLLDHCFQ